MLGVGLPLLLSNGEGSMQVNLVTVAGCIDNVEAVWHNVDILHASALGVIQFHTNDTCQLLPRHVADIGFKRFNSCHGIRHTGELIDATRVCNVVA